jgi:hypothetical protein
MVAAAILAANQHNTQPWIFQVTDDRIDVFADPARPTGTLDPLGREHQVGLGCAVENLLLAAAPRAYASSPALLPGGPSQGAVRLSPGPRRHSTLYEVIADRHSNRGPFHAAPVPASVLASLAGLAEGLPGVQLTWFTTPAQRAGSAG